MPNHSVTLFSRTPSHGQEENNDFVSLFFEQTTWGKLLELVNDYDRFQLQKINADQFSLTVGQHEFKVERDFHRCMITMSNISTLLPGAAELLAKIADLMFYDRKQRLMIAFSKPEFEKTAWQACFTQKIPLKPVDQAQASRFQEWASKNSLQNKVKGLGFGQTLPSDPKNNPAPPRERG